jgi:predicted membrane protein
MKNKHLPEFIVILIVLIAGIGVLTFNQVSNHQAKKVDQTSTTSKKKVTKPTFKGKWQGSASYPNNQKVTIEVNFTDSKNYTLTESNTVSQVWKRIYTGTYTKSKGVVKLTPESVVVTTYASTDDVTSNNVRNSETVAKSDFYRQFGNQQTGTVKIKSNHLMVQHDHEKIKLHLVK